jgi:hypothetical protein
LLLVAIALLVAVVVPFFTREVYLKLWGPVGATVHRDEWPGFYWPVMAAEVALAGFLIYLSF